MKMTLPSDWLLLLDTTDNKDGMFFNNKSIPVTPLVDNCSHFKDFNKNSLSGGEGVYLALVIICSPLNVVVNSVGFVFCALHRRSSSHLQQRDLLKLLMSLAIGEVLFNVSFLLQTLLFYGMRRGQLSGGEDADAGCDASCSLRNIRIMSVLMAVLRACICWFHMLRNWTVCIISLMRMLAVGRPFTVYKYFTQKVATKLYLLALIICCVIALPRTFESTFLRCIDDDTIVFNLNSPLWDSKVYAFAYYAVTLFITQSGGPVIMVSIFSTITALLLRKHKVRRKQLCKNGSMTSISADQPELQKLSNADRTVIILCAFFFIFELPLFFSKLWMVLKLDQWMGLFDEVYVFTANLMTILDSFFNCLVYVMGANRYLVQFRCASTMDGRTSVSKSATVVKQERCPADEGDVLIVERVDGTSERFSATTDADPRPLLETHF